MEMHPPEHGGGDPDKMDEDAVMLGDLDTMDQDLDQLEEWGLEELDLNVDIDKVFGVLIENHLIQLV